MSESFEKWKLGQYTRKIFVRVVLGLHLGFDSSLLWWSGCLVNIVSVLINMSGNSRQQVEPWLGLTWASGLDCSGLPTHSTRTPPFHWPCQGSDVSNPPVKGWFHEELVTSSTKALSNLLLCQWLPDFRYSSLPMLHPRPWAFQKMNLSFSVCL